MYTIDLDKATANDVIMRSYTCHTTMLKEAIDQAREAHRNAAATMINGQARLGADQLAGKCARLIQRIEDHVYVTTFVNLMDFDEKIITFTAAARLQGIAGATARNIVKR